MSVIVDLRDETPPKESIQAPENQPPANAAEINREDAFFVYKKECRIAWIKYLGLLGRVKLRDGPDGLPYFIGMPPEYSTFRIHVPALEGIQKMVLGNPKNSLISLENVLSVLRKRPVHTHIAWHAVQQKLAHASVAPATTVILESLKWAINLYREDRNHLNHWESMGSRNSLILLNTTTTTTIATKATAAQPSPGKNQVPKAILPVMNRMVGIRTLEEDPASCPGYILPMASFERAVWNAEKAKTEDQKRQYAETALRSLRRFMDSHKNEPVLEKLTEYLEHFEALAAVEKADQSGK
ncbi:hypothetical protein F66182_242 [Fusarium sp. NRRL 66182]|nr:hypothetical protein F66182_242 [Fusarium sp. NRRL 66182]